MREVVYMNNVGLVLAGGGGKGAYEVGAWIALQDMIKELKLNITAFSGASVGALNAALFACNTPKEIENIWSSVTQKKILPLDIENIRKKILLQDIEYIEDIENIVSSYLCDDMIMESLLCNKTDIKGEKIKALIELLTLLFPHGFCSREGLEELIEKAEIGKRIEAVRTDVIASCYNKKIYKKVEYKKLNNKNYNDVLLASSAIPVIYRSQKIGNEYYEDGGVRWGGDNCPIKPLLEKHAEMKYAYRKFIVIHLGGNDKNSFNSLNLKGCKVYHIFPQINLGGFLGTLNFCQKEIQNKIKQAKNDIENEYEFFDEINELFNCDCNQEMHLLNGVCYSNLDEVYKERKKGNLTTSYEEFVDKLAKHESIKIRNKRFKEVVNTIHDLSDDKYRYVSCEIKKLEIMELTPTVLNSSIVESMIKILGKDVFETLTTMMLKSKTFDIISQIKNYIKVESGEDMLLIPMQEDFLLEPFKRVNRVISNYLEELGKIDIIKYQNQINSYYETIDKINEISDIDKLNKFLMDSYEKLNIKIPWEGDFDTFMGDKSNHLVFE